MHEAEKVFKAVAGKCKIAVRIGVIRFDNRFIARQPGALSFAGEFLIPVARRKLCQGIASVPLTLDQSHAFGHCHARGRERIFTGRAAHDQPVDLVVIILDIAAHHHRAHAMAE